MQAALQECQPHAPRAPALSRQPEQGEVGGGSPKEGSRLHRFPGTGRAGGGGGSITGEDDSVPRKQGRHGASACPAVPRRRHQALVPMQHSICSLSPGHLFRLEGALRGPSKFSLGVPAGQVHACGERPVWSGDHRSPAKGEEGQRGRKTRRNLLY